MVIRVQECCLLFEDEFFYVFKAECEDINAEDDVDKKECEEGQDEACEGREVVGDKCDLFAEEGKACRGKEGCEEIVECKEDCGNGKCDQDEEKIRKKYFRIAEEQAQCMDAIVLIVFERGNICASFFCHK